MPTYPQTITNPGAETGNTTGWTTSNAFAYTGVHHSGAYSFLVHGSIKQTITVDPSLYTVIDHGQVSASLQAYHYVDGNASGHFSIAFYSSENALLGSSATSDDAPASWTLETLSPAVPAGTRSMVISATGNSSFFGSYWDDFTLTLIDSGTPNYASQERATQVVAYGLVSQPAAQLRTTQVAVLSVSAGETSSGQHLMKTHQVVAYALVKGKVDRVDLRAWTFLQDDHLFYGLQLGKLGTIIHDVTTQQWCQWYSPGFNYWRAEDVTDWEGYNLACDTENGTIWKIDPSGRLDDGDTVITSTVTGQATVRGRRVIPCYMAEIACSQASPAASGTSIQLRTSDDGGDNWVDHGTLSGAALGTATLFRYNGLGVMQAPGRIFEITNVGYARRIDGLDLELGAKP